MLETVVDQHPRSMAAPDASIARDSYLDVRGLSRDFGGHAVVSDATFQVARGEFFGLLGPSGCGKSTTLNMIAGFVQPSAGEVRLDGRRLNNVPPHERGTAMVFQDYALFPHLTAAENVAFGPEVRRAPRAMVQQRVRALLDLVGLAGHASQRPAQLSGGQQQRVAVARALAIDPRVVLLDEPFSNLDARLRETMRRELKQILHEAGVTVILVTHDRSEAFATCDRVAIMLGGQIVQIGSPDDVYRRPRDPDIARFIGDCNFFEATVLEVRQDVVRVRVVVGPSTGDCLASRSGPCAPGDTGVVLVRPESVVIGDQDAPDTPFAATVSRVEFLGPTSQYFLQLQLQLQLESPGDSIMAHHLSGRVHGVGNQVAIGWRMDDAVFFAGRRA